jgi:hypothetical protein
MIQTKISAIMNKKVMELDDIERMYIPILPVVCEIREHMDFLVKYTADLESYEAVAATIIERCDELYTIVNDTLHEIGELEPWWETSMDAEGRLTIKPIIPEEEE